MSFGKLGRALPLYPVLILIAVLVATPLVAEDFTVIVLPDTQFYSKDFPEIFTAQTRWVADNIAVLNVKFVIGEGDIVNGGGFPVQWQNADAAVRLLDGKVPYFMAIGNHDYNSPSAIPTRTTGATNFNKWFGPARYASYPWYRGQFPKGSNENFYGVVTANGTDYLILALEFYPRDSALAWANSVILAHPDKPVILVTHSYLNFDDYRVDLCDTGGADEYGLGADNNGEELWYKFVRKHPNIFLVLNGHILGDGAGRRADYGVNGNLINQLFVNFQHEALGGGGYLRILNFHPELNTIEVSTYSPYLGTSKIDPQNQFTITYLSNQPPTEGVGSFQGRVKDGTTCGAIGAATVAYSEGQKLTNAGGDYFFDNVLAPTTHNVTVNKSGYRPVVRTVEITPTLSAPLRFFPGIGGTLIGRVTDSSGVAIPNALVSTSQGGVLTGANGQYSLDYLPAGNYDVAASAAGYISGGARISLLAGTSKTVNIALKPGSPPEPPCRLNVTDPSVTICAPADGAAVTSPVRVVAGTTDLYPVTLLQIYVDGIAQFNTKSNVVDTNLPLLAGLRRVTVQAKDASGAIFKQTLNITVSDADVSLLPTSLDFGSQIIGTTSSPKSFVLANHTQADIEISEISAAGPFTIAGNNCGTTLAPATNCQVDVVFTPATTGPHSGSLTASSSDPASPHVASLAGAGASESPVCTPNPIQPSVTICTPQNGATTTSPVRIVAVTNNANPVGLVQIYIDGVKATEKLSSSIDVELPMLVGVRRVTVQAKDTTGTIFKQTINITVQ